MGRRLYKARQDKFLDGVCAGIAKYFNVDPVLVRLIWFIGFIFIGQFFWGVIAYLIAMVIIPVEPSGHRTQSYKNKGDDLGREESTVSKSSDSDASGENEFRSDHSEDNYADEYPHRSGSSTSLLFGLICISIGVLIFLGNIFDFNLRSWIRMSSDMIWPAIFIGIGLLLLVKRPKR